MEKLDVIFLAPDIGSLFGAVSLAAGGLKLLVLEEQTTPLTLKNADGENVPVPREPFLWRGLRTGAFLEPLLNRLKLLINARGMVDHAEPPVQVVTPDARVDYFGSDQQLARELKREFDATEAKRVGDVLGNLTEWATKAYELTAGDAYPPMSLGLAGRLFRREPDCRRELNEILKIPMGEFVGNGRVSGPARVFLECIIAGLGLPVSNDLPACVAGLLLDGSRRGIYRADEQALSRLLISTFKKTGGYTMPISELEAVEMSKGGISALRMVKSNYIYSRLFVASETYISLLAEKTPGAVTSIRNRVHTLTVLAQSRVVPVGMGDRVVVVNRGSEMLYPEHVSRISVHRTAQADDKSEVFFTVESVRPAGMESAQDELWDALRNVAPFIDEYVISHKYDVKEASYSTSHRRAFLELPSDNNLANLLPRESDLLAEMGMGEGVISGRILPRVILRKLGLRTE